MGCSPSTLFSRKPAPADGQGTIASTTTNPTTNPTTTTKEMHKFVRPANFKQPSFTAAYARAVRRYGIGPGKFAGQYAFVDNRVVKFAHDSDASHEVPATSIQNE
jgi:hypothetical protein